MRELLLASLKDWWLGSTPESTTAMPMPVPSRVMFVVAARAESVPVVSETWPSVLTSLSNERYATSGRFARLLTAATGRSTARKPKFVYLRLMVPLLFFTAVSSVEVQEPWERIITVTRELAEEP